MVSDFASCAIIGKRELVSYDEKNSIIINYFDLISIDNLRI